MRRWREHGSRRRAQVSWRVFQQQPFRTSQSGLPGGSLETLTEYANTYIWNLKQEKKGSEEPRGQDRNKDADVENGLEDTGRRKGKLGRSERVALTYTLPNVK